MFILSPELDDSGAKDEIKRLTSLLEDEGAKVGKIDEWGRRRFAYEMNHQVEGYYFVLVVEGEPSAMDELTRVGNLSDNVMRLKVVRLPEMAS